MNSSVLDHLHHLAVTIGPRGSTTAGEKAAARYAFEQLETAGLSPHWEPFQAPVSGWRPFVIAPLLGIGVILLLQTAVTPLHILAFFIALLTIQQIIAELYFRPTIFQRLTPHGDSQNVWAKVAARTKAKQKLLLVGHLDTHRTPWVFSTERRLTFFRALSSLGMVINLLMPLLALLIVLDSLWNGRLLTWVWNGRPYLLLLIPIHLLITAVSWQADQTPYTAGANDNASGAAIVLSLAQQLAQSPLQSVEVWALCTGCEEVGIHGMQTFIRQHKGKLDGVMGISIDNVGGQGDGVCFTTKEGILFQLTPGEPLFSMAQELAAERPSFNAYARPFTFLHTDGTCMMAAGIPTLSFVGLTPDGRLPHWHQISDTIEQITPQAVTQTEAFILTLLHNLDSKMTAVS